MDLMSLLSIKKIIDEELTKHLGPGVYAERTFQHTELDPSDEGDVRVVRGKHKKSLRSSKRKKLQYYESPFPSITKEDREQKEA